MKNLMYVVSILAILVLITACSGPRIVCNKPYIRVGTECCLDYNNDSVCDKDESLISTVGSAVAVLENLTVEPEKTVEPTITKTTTLPDKITIKDAYWNTMYPKTSQEIELTIEFENQGSTSIDEFEYVVKIYKGDKVSKEDTYEYSKEIVSGGEGKAKDLEYTFSEEGDYKAKIYPKDNEESEKTVSFYVKDTVAKTDDEENSTEDNDTLETTSQCTDSDGGRMTTKLGYCTDSAGKHEDKCVGSGMLLEMYCDSLKPIGCFVYQETCTCEDGVCV